MNDYKELIDGLQRLEFFNQRAGRELWADKPHDVQERDIESAQNILLSAIGTIEQLVKERDAAVADLHLVANNCFEDYVFSACRCCHKNDTCNGRLQLVASLSGAECGRITMRLIDADALCDGLVSNHPVVIHANAAPTIIPADKEGE